MKKTLIGMAATFVITFVVVTAALVLCGSGEGIVILEDYEHGVAFCEEEFYGVVHQADASVWNDGTATYVVNAGHYDDPEVKELVKLTHEVCAQLKEVK